MAGKRRTFSKEFKLNTVKLHLDGKNGGCRALSRELGLNNPKMLMNWVHQYEKSGEEGLEDKRGKSKHPNRGRPRTVGKTIEDENLKLRAENEYLRKMLDLAKDNIKKKHTT